MPARRTSYVAYGTGNTSFNVKLGPNRISASGRIVECKVSAEQNFKDLLNSEKCHCCHSNGSARRCTWRERPCRLTAAITGVYTLTYRWISARKLALDKHSTTVWCWRQWEKNEKHSRAVAEKPRDAHFHSLLPSPSLHCLLSLSVCLLATLTKNYTDRICMKFYRRLSLDKEDTITFWKSSATG